MSKTHHYDRPEGLVALPSGGALRSVRRDDVIQWVLRCPACGAWADIDDDQFHGRVSVDHTDTGCRYHETHDFAVFVETGRANP